MRVLPASGVCLALAALAGCSPTVSQSGYLVLAASSVPPTHMTALIEGEVALSSDCYAIDVRGTRYVTVFPVGTHIADGDRIDIPGVGTLALGDEISGGGGEVPVAESPVDVPDSCSAETVIIFEAP